MKWQYLVTEDEASLNRLGEKGWELVAVAEKKFYLKKPVPGLKEQITDKQREQIYKQLGMRGTE